MRIENCVIITSKDSLIEMTADELRHLFAGNCIVDRDQIKEVLSATTPTTAARSRDQDAALAQPGRTT